ncbi:myosin light chain kinase, smooth muscle-like isoform X3 [Dreissena polymorpha]|uniref:myosin light chain kinase, smooth muscle-like isoform X3 n=1 Tax=Dreissena polymorpha TaxID=45954 RepID=UPI002263BEA8|nr:myosin light chain kinase, smooth muscle-like isoform X3 [Dreissena polymorpha]
MSYTKIIFKEFGVTLTKVRPKSQTGKKSMFVAPTVDIPLEDTEFADKEKDATLVCKFHNAIDGKARWLKDGREVSSFQTKATFDGRTAKLVLREASKKICGTYECIVKNSGGEAKSKAEVSLMDPKVVPVPPKFTVSLADTDIDLGEKLVLETQVTGKPRPSLKWYKDNQELGSSQDIRMEYKEGKGRLIVDNLDPAEGSKFTCVAKNIAGEDTTVAAVKVTGSSDQHDPPIFTKELSDMDVKDGNRVELSVEVKGTPPIDIVWVHNNREIPHTDPVCRMVTRGNTHMLIIPEVFPEDSGEYVCEAYNSYGDTDTFCRLNVHEADDSTQIEEIQQTAPVFVIRPSNAHVCDHESVTLKCQVSGEPPPSVQWQRGRQTLKHGDKYKISSIGDEHFLEIVSATTNDIGQYTCTLCNLHGSTSATCDLTVGEVTPNNSLPSRFLLRKRSQDIYNGKSSTTDSEGSDISSSEAEQFKSSFALKRSSLPLVSSSPKQQISEPKYSRAVSSPGTSTHVTSVCIPTPTIKEVPEEIIKPKVIEFDFTKRSIKCKEIAGKKNESIKDNQYIENKSLSDKSSSSDKIYHASEVKIVKNVAQSQETDIKAAFVESVPIPGKNLPVNKLKSPKSLSYENKGGITQVDFRGLLKNTSDKPSDSSDSTVSSGKPLCETDQGFLKSASKEPKVDLSQRKKLFERSLTNESVPNGVHKKSDKSVVKAGKIDKAQKQFESQTLETKSDFRTVLKPRKDNSSSEKIPIGEEVKQVDFRNLLKHKISAESVSDKKTEVRSTAVTVTQSDSNNSSPSAFETFAKLEKTSTAQLSLLEKRQSKANAGKLTLDLKKPKENKSRAVASKFDFKSVLTSKESEHLKAHCKYNGEVVKPQPRRISQSKLAVMETKPVFKDQLCDCSVEHGSQVVLECQVTGIPPPNVSWSVNKTEIKQSKYFRMSYTEDRAKLVIAEVYSEDEGEYTCTATNASGSAQTSCNIVVLDRPDSPVNLEDENDEPFSPTATPPKIYNICPAEFCIKRGGTIEFKASYTSVPPGTVMWYKNKEELKSDSRRKIETSEHFSTLTIDNIQPSDSGKFYISVENRLGHDTAFASLTVEDVPEPPAGQPGVSEVTLTSATVSWYGPAFDGGCPVSNYRLEMCDAEEQEWTLVTSKCISTTYRVDQLKPHTPYFFRVFAENKHGLSQPCQTPEVTVTSDRRPSAFLRLPSTESDDVFMHETNEPFTPLSEYGLVSPLSPVALPSRIDHGDTDEVPFEHREVTLKPGRVFENFYSTIEEVGKGKFGTVFKCEEKATGKIWAAKVIKCSDEAQRKKFKLEIEIMNQLQHPKILLLWDAFEGPRKSILVMEYIGGGELFERLTDDDFDLLERDCIQFMRQICDAVHYMHTRNILHLDLKPENILCIKNESNKIKIIDFGLARYYRKGESVRVLFGTPEFVAPEVINYDEIGFTTDMWSVGVVCYLLLAGDTPFRGDSDVETLTNVTKGEFEMDEEDFNSVSQDAKNFINSLLMKNKDKRLSSQKALEHPWLAEDTQLKNHRINTKNLKRFMARRKWQKTGNAIRALGRITLSQKMLKNNNSTKDSSSSTASGEGSQSSSSSSLGSGGTLTVTENSTSSLKESTRNKEVTANKKGEHSNVTNQNKGGGSAKQTHTGDGLDVNNYTKYDQDLEKRMSDHLASVDLNSNERNSALPKSPNQKSGNCDVSMQKTDLCDNCIKNTSLYHNSHSQSMKPSCTIFNKKMVDTQAFPGDVVRFDIGFEADAQTTVTWYFEDEIIVEDNRHSILKSKETCSLIIKDVCEDDDGEYSCKIVNSKGEDECSSELIVYGAL